MLEKGCEGDRGIFMKLRAIECVHDEMSFVLEPDDGGYSGASKKVFYESAAQHCYAFIAVYTGPVE
jgi:hypothetical protein